MIYFDTVSQSVASGRERSYLPMARRCMGRPVPAAGSRTFAFRYFTAAAIRGAAELVGFSGLPPGA